MPGGLLENQAQLLLLFVFQIDCAKLRSVDESEGRLWAEGRGFLYFETSAQTGEGINEMFQVKARVPLATTTLLGFQFSGPSSLRVSLGSLSLISGFKAAKLGEGFEPGLGLHKEAWQAVGLHFGFRVLAGLLLGHN